ncbi:dis1-suppressing kinase dsk1 [Fusarium tjaetaba]|uniref:non-specific serine/threonine protein kinase n=1 Tax=Fusarium tjaetaba TaxID=1567544 RepID=A0A8H5VAM6_9HYPO|nr:dis1-suppressing kinase dsk1 [Fusarium tjaetaba]KAF5615020.1 dis1-suppressing kinase dsk1 [Fusarium tjaetaba]
MSTSPPPTPPSRAPGDQERRFKDITSPCEWIEDYRPGGFHPVHLGDLFNDGQFKVIRKLGEGAYSTVWLAHDLRNSRYVALKILISETTEETSHELHVLHHLAKVGSQDRIGHVTQLLTDFEHKGPNGIHKCLVFEPMGPSVNSMVYELPQFKPRKYGMKIRYPPQIAKRILLQSLQGLEFLHENGVAHGDFQPGNILFSVQSIDSLDEASLRQEENVQAKSISPPVERLDGKQDKWAPRYLCLAQPLAPYASVSENLRVKLSDMGGAYFLNDPPKKPITPLGLRAPELVLMGEVDKSLDIWSFGCLVFELVTGQPLFCVPAYNHRTEEDDNHILELQAKLGPLPDELYSRWETSSRYYTKDRKLYNCQLGGVGEGEEPLMLEQTSMEEAFDLTNPDLTDEEAEKVKRLVRRILQYDPSKRPMIKDILCDPWPASYDTPMGGVRLCWSYSLFNPTAPGNADECDDHSHLGQISALIGPPPQSLLSSGQRTSMFYKLDGELKNPGLVPTPGDFSFENTIGCLGGEEKLRFIRFIKRMVRRSPEERSIARELLDDPWLYEDFPQD